MTGKANHHAAEPDTPRPLLVFFKELARSGHPSQEGNLEGFNAFVMQF